MRILLINPPRSMKNKVYDYAPEDAKQYVHRKLIGPPLGLLTIAAACNKDYDVDVIEMKAFYDLNPEGPGIEDYTLEHLKRFKPDIVGVTFIASEFPYGIKIFKTVKKYNKNILTVAGGLHATIYTQGFNDESVDIVCPGRAVKNFLKIINAKEKGLDLKKIAGIFINTEDGLVKTGGRSYKFDAVGDDFITPDRSYIKKWLNAYKLVKTKGPTTYLYTSLGCPYECSFCSIWPQFDGKFYQRRIESIIEELKTLDDYAIVRFADANTIVNVQVIDKLFDRIKEEGIDKEYVMDIRFDTIVNNPKLIEKMTKMGLKAVICGFESFREEELKRYNKSSSANLIEKAIKILNSNGIWVRGSYVVPPDYDENDFKAMADYSNQHKVVLAGYSILTPMPGTAFYEEIKDQIIDHDLTKYNFFNCVLKTKLPLEKFYENIGNLWKIKLGDFTLKQEVKFED